MKKHLSPNGQIIFICQRLHEKGLVNAYGGNVSVRSGNNIIITPSHSPLATLAEDDLVVVTETGEVHFGIHEPSTELALHLAIYQARPDVRGVIHTHPTATTAFAFIGKTITPVNPESRTHIPNVPVIPPLPFDSEDMRYALREALTKSNVALLHGHGLITVGESLMDAYTLTSLVEQTAMINVYIKVLTSGESHESTT